jgi:hypothetical protein
MALLSDLAGAVFNVSAESAGVKAAFFGSLGYEAGAWQRLEADLRGQLLPQPARQLENTPYGRKFVVRGRLVGPSGKAEQVTSVWIVLTAEDFPRFVTAYPGGRR